MSNQVMNKIMEDMIGKIPPGNLPFGGGKCQTSLRELYGNSLPPRIWPLMQVGTYLITFPLVGAYDLSTFNLPMKVGAETYK